MRHKISKFSLIIFLFSSNFKLFGNPCDEFGCLCCCNDKIEAITGRRPILHRAPYGEYTNNLLNTLSSLNMYCVQWDIDSLDWRGYDANRIYKKVVSRVKPGSICLFHNAAKHTPEALPKIIEKLLADGYEILPISKLIYKNNYTINFDGEQIPNETPTENSSN